MDIIKPELSRDVYFLSKEAASGIDVNEAATSCAAVSYEIVERCLHPKQKEHRRKQHYM